MAILLIVVEDGLHALDAWVVLSGVIFLRGRLVPIQDPANERRDKVGTSFRCGDRLGEGEHQGQVTIDSMLGLQSMCSLDAFPCRCELDKDPGLVDADRLIELDLFLAWYRTLHGNGHTSIMCKALSMEP